MTITFQNLLLLFVSLFTLYSPLSNIGPYSSLMEHLPREDQKKLAYSVAINACVVLLLFVWIGQLLFDLLGVNSSSLSIAGGIALMAAGLPMMLGSDATEKVEPDEKKGWREMSVLPMTFPMTIGGTTAGYVVAASSFAKGYVDLVAISVVVLLFALVVWCTIHWSPPLAARLSPQAQRVLNRVSGIILVAIAIQLFAGGIKGLFPVLNGS